MERTRVMLVKGSRSGHYVMQTEHRWRDIFWRESDTCPPWYAELKREEHRLYWTETYGADIYDCYMQMLVESV